MLGFQVGASHRNESYVYVSCRGDVKLGYKGKGKQIINMKTHHAHTVGKRKGILFITERREMLIRDISSYMLAFFAYSTPFHLVLGLFLRDWGRGGGGGVKRPFSHPSRKNPGNPNRGWLNRDSPLSSLSMLSSLNLLSIKTSDY